FHGCAGRYRQLREQWMNDRRWKVSDPKTDPMTDELHHLLVCTEGLVFTFRDILYWRQDGWARDLVRSELRTKCAVLTGFSGNDPVLHDTFRGVYEEVTKIRERNRRSGSLERMEASTDEARAAPAYYFGQKGNRDLAPMEILQESRRAAGLPPLSFHQHEAEGQQLPFRFKGKGFPDYDQVFTILQHLTQRKRQMDFLERYLEMAVDSMREQDKRGWNGAELREERAELTRRFETLVENEKKCLEELLQDDEDDKEEKTVPRAKFYGQLVGWTHTFIPSLLREWAIFCQRTTDERRTVRVRGEIRRHLYFPTEDEPVWTTRCVIAELAIRQMVAFARCGEPEQGLDPRTSGIEVVQGDFDARIRFPDCDSTPTDRARNELRIAWSGIVRQNQRTRLSQAPPRSRVVWRGIDGGNSSRHTPSQAQLWRFAACSYDNRLRSTARKHLRAHC
ncbi:MAG: hypothetical protein AAF585_21670, partial [Verrucomicrobiota bacterium]